MYKLRKLKGYLLNTLNTNIMKTYVFWYHYNKANSKRANKPQLTVHYRGVCYAVDNLIINVNTFGHIRKGEQPNFVVKGTCKSFEIINNIAYIN